jgi:non-ribosomal peptide synthetase component F
LAFRFEAEGRDLSTRFRLKHSEAIPMTITCVHHYLERQAFHRPESIFLLEGATQSSYGQIEAGANRVAHFL